jgi:4-hydroxy-3-polyprenylbenzoate decarboxylase
VNDGPRASRPVQRLVLGVGGASGAIYAERLLRFFAETRAAEVAVVFTKTGRLVWTDEIGTDPKDYGFPLYNPADLTAPFASGSALYDAMVVAPCSAAGMARIAHGLSADLVGRAADVMLKERRPLLLVVREAPYSLVHLRNMVAVTEGGATIIPASPSFYSRPSTIEALVDTITSRVLDHLGFDHALMKRWTGRDLGGTS